MSVRWSLRLNGSEIESTVHFPGRPALRAAKEAQAQEVERLSQMLLRMIQEHLHGVGEEHADSLRKRGQALFSYVCPAQVRDILAEYGGTELRIDSDRAIPSIPWEFLHNGDSYLALNHILSREILLDSLPEVAPAGSLPRMLILADPGGDLKQAWEEGDRLLELVTKRFPELAGRVEFRSRDVSADWLLDQIWDFDLLHYAGHMVAVKDGSGRTSLAFSLGGRETLTFRQIREAGGGRSLPSIMFLNACGPDAFSPAGTAHDPAVHGTEGGASRLLEDLAQEAMAGGTRALVGVPVKLPDAPLSVDFAETFHQGLLSGETVGRALHAARRRLLTAYPGRLLPCAFALFGDPSSACVQEAVASAGSGGGRAEAPVSTSQSVPDYRQCRRPGCFSGIGPDSQADPLNAFCDAHALSAEQKRTEANRLCGSGEWARWWPREEVKSAMESYAGGVRRRVDSLCVEGGGWLDLGPHLEGYRFSVKSPAAFEPIRRATPLATSLRILRDARGSAEFAQEQTGVIRVTVSRSGRLRSERREIACRVILHPDNDACLRDDLLWRPMPGEHLDRLARILMHQELGAVAGRAPGMQPGDEKTDHWVWAWITPLGVESIPVGGFAWPFAAVGKGFVPAREQDCAAWNAEKADCHQLWSLLQPAMSSHDVSGSGGHDPVPRDANPWLRAALEAVRGLLAPRTDAELRAAVLDALFAQDDLEEARLADQARVPLWLMRRTVDCLADEAKVRCTTLDDGTVFVSLVHGGCTGDR